MDDGFGPAAEAALALVVGCGGAAAAKAEVAGVAAPVVVSCCGAAAVVAGVTGVGAPVAVSSGAAAVAETELAGVTALPTAAPVPGEGSGPLSAGGASDSFGGDGFD